MPQNPDMDSPQNDDAGTKMNAWNSLLYTLGGPPASTSHSTNTDAELVIDQIPVTILSGFLGAGKTTLLCNLLADTRTNVLAIVNDLAGVNIDAALVRSSNAETLQLENGCACCVLGNDLDLMLREIGCREEKPEAIIIEASGVSDPMGIAQTVANNSATTLDGILTLVDAKALKTQLIDPVAASLMKRQLAAAHLVLLTKAENESVVADLQRALGELAPGRAVISVESTAADLEDLVLGASVRGARLEPGVAHHSYDRFASRVVRFCGPVPGDAFFSIVDRMPACVYRVKGALILRKDGEDVHYHFQAVGPRWRVNEIDGKDASAQLVVIGLKGSTQYDEFCERLANL